MKKAVFVFTAVFLLLSVLKAGDSVFPETAMKKISDDNQASRYVLPNGMVVLLKEEHKNPVASIEVWIKTGSAFEDRLTASGVSHFVEHMLFKGTEKRDVGDAAKEIQNYGGEINAHTSFDYTVYTVNIDSRYFLNACEILGDCIMNAAFDKDETEKERSVILKEIYLNDDDPERRIYKIFFNTIYSTHPYKDPVIGYEDIFKKIKREDLINYFKERYVPNNIVFVAAGDFDRKAAYEKLKEIFKDFNRESLKPVYIPSEPNQMGKRTRIEEADINKTYLFLGFHTTDIKDPDSYALDVLSLILGEGNSSRLYRTLREKLSLVNSISSWSFTPVSPGIFAVNSVLNPENFEKTRDEILKEVYRLRSEAVGEDELEKAKQSVISEYYFSLETASGQATDIGYSEVATGNFNYSRDYVEKIKKISKEDILRAANRYFYDDNLTISALVPKGYRAADTAAASKESAGEIKKIEFPNGLKLLVREDHSLPTMNVKALLRGGLIVEDEINNGISNLCSQLLLKGTRNMSADQIAEAIESAGGSIASYSANNSFGCSVEILSEKKDLAIDILADVMMNPAFNERDIEKEKKAVLLNIKSLEDQPFQAASKLFRETMFRGHPYRFLPIGTVQSVSGIKRDELINFHSKYVVPENMVITVFGDVKADEIKKKIEERFGHLKNTGLSFPKTRIDYKKGVMKEKKAAKGKQAVVILGYHSVDIFSPEKYPFEVLDALFSGQGSRLFAAVRDEEGLAYALGSYVITGLDPGAFVFFAATVPEKVDRVVELIRKEIENLKKDGVASEELIRVKNGLIGVKKIQLQTNGQLALQAGLDELYGLGYDDYKKYYDKVNEVSEEDIKKVSRKYFLSDDYVIVVLSQE